MFTEDKGWTKIAFWLSLAWGIFSLCFLACEWGWLQGEWLQIVQVGHLSRDLRGRLMKGGGRGGRGRGRWRGRVEVEGEGGCGWGNGDWMFSNFPCKTFVNLFTYIHASMYTYIQIDRDSHTIHKPHTETRASARRQNENINKHS